MERRFVISLGRSDALVSALISATTDQVRDEDGDDEQGESDADGDRDDVVRAVVAVKRSLKDCTS